MKVIYTLRSQCIPCGLDKADDFTRIPNATPSQVIAQLKPHIRRKFREKYGCTHRIKFTRIVDPNYKWDEVNNVLVAR